MEKNDLQILELSRFISDASKSNPESFQNIPYYMVCNDFLLAIWNNKIPIPQSAKVEEGYISFSWGNITLKMVYMIGNRSPIYKLYNDKVNITPRGFDLTWKEYLPEILNIQ